VAGHEHLRRSRDEPRTHLYPPAGATDRVTQFGNYQSQLQICNPVTGQWVGSAACAGYHLTVANPPNAVQQKLVAARQQQAQLESVVSSEEAQQQKLTSAVS
jgi:hypothetical protein